MTEIEGLRTHGGDDHARDNLDGDCDVCDTDHRILSSLPNQPLSLERFEEIEAQDGILLARSIVSVPGTIVGSDAEKVSEDLLLATENVVRSLTRYGESGGWIVKQELPVPEDQSPTDFALAVYQQLSDEFSHVDEDDLDRQDLIQ